MGNSPRKKPRTMHEYRLHNVFVFITAGRIHNCRSRLIYCWFLKRMRFKRNSSTNHCCGPCRFCAVGLKECAYSQTRVDAQARHMNGADAFLSARRGLLVVALLALRTNRHWSSRSLA